MTKIDFYPDKEVGKIEGWWWISTDTGAWIGPKEDWERNFCNSIRKNCDNFRTVIQAGGNQGMYPKLLSKLFENVYTFEPDVDNFRALNMNCVESNIYRFQAALGENKCLVDLTRTTMENTGMHHVNSNLGNIQMFALDDLAFRDVDLLFLDLEGYEINSLLGAQRLIHEFHPVVIIERPSEPVHKFLQMHGYNYSEVLGKDTLFKVDK